MTVVDSSVLVDLQLGTVTIDQLGAEPIAAPHLVDSEFLHAMRGLVIGRVVAEDEAKRMIRGFEQLVIERYPAAALSRRVWELRDNLTAYDATYVALAESLDTRLLTTDARTARAPGIRCVVEVL